MSNSPDKTADACRTAARQQALRGDRGAAERSFLSLLERHPQDVEALRFVADCQSARGEHAAAMQSLQAVTRVAPEDPAAWVQLAATQMAADDPRGAVASFGRGLALAPRMFVPRLQLGIALEQLGQPHDALKAYFMAIESAHGMGRWQDDATTAPGLRDTVKHAVDYVNRERRALFRRALDPLRERYGSAQLTRVERSLAIYFLDLPANIPDPRQRPKFLYFPDITSQPYYPRHRFPWLEALEAATDSVRDELRAVLSEERALESFLGEAPPDAMQGMLGSSGDQEPAWDAYFFHRHGERRDAHRARCPRTAALLDALPLVRIRDHAPEALFSVLSPGTHILPHTGVTNTRLVTHLPLIVPPDCAIRVGGQEHAWQEGRCVTFDDTWEHEAWNRSGQRRVVLIVDSWHPDLSEVERAAVTDLVEAIGDFNQSCKLPDTPLQAGRSSTMSV
ncbi:aspartyl beta-hydroxylase [Rhodanobacter sp. B05]|uniref:aspartyl/asparaginyl beta-hydroxylase domain-containing protein n=1 Tax=Rhodanobacter sp. B05 TaxID=1945859 RepID=UPI000985CB26|nr:aspartyl/asparaginyl beta-hydroxylase domain-containing protein [Rhodanobacter sp. B05]OOG57826.1 aspartyl beta-hydroxylase [Rhodanobacter sp. B05]